MTDRSRRPDASFGYIAVNGYCPMGCGETLVLATGGDIECSATRCADPTRAATVLEDPESEHIVTLRENDFTVRHPLRERDGTELEECLVHRDIAQWPGPPQEPGRYRVYKSILGRADEWQWQRLGDLR